MSIKNTNINQSFSETIEMMRFPLIFLVVIAHMVPFETPRVYLSANVDDIYTLVSELLSHNLAKISVRCYFLISAFFFFRSLETWDWNVFGIKLKKKVRTLFIPYVIWNVILILAIAVKSNAFAWLGFGVDEGWLMLQSTSWYQWFWGMPINFPLWYMRDLMCMILLAPLFYVFFLYTRAYGLALLAAIYLALVELGIPGFSTTAFFFFGAGAYLAMRGKDVISLFATYRKSIGILTLVLLMSATFYNGTIYHEYILRVFIIVGVVTTVNLFNYLRKFNRLKRVLFALAPTTFFIYVVHEIYIINWLKGGLARMGETGTIKLVGYFLVPCICIVICIGLYYLLKKIAPKWIAIALGGRIVPYVKGGKG